MQLVMQGGNMPRNMGDNLPFQMDPTLAQTPMQGLSSILLQMVPPLPQVPVQGSSSMSLELPNVHHGPNMNFEM